MDVPAKQLSSDMTLSYLSKPYVMFSLYGAQNTLMFSLPELMDGQITMRTDTFGRDYNASVLSEAASVTLPEDYALTLFHETETFPMDMENMTITKLESTDAFEGFDSIPPATQDTDYYACTWDNSRTEVICMVNDTPLITAAVIRNIDLQDVSPDTSESPVAETDSATDYAPESMDILFSKYGNNLETYAKLYDADKTVLYTAAMSGKFSGGSDFMNETQSLCYNFDSLILTDSVNGISLTLYGDVSIQAPQTAIEAPTGKQYDIFHMSMEDIQTLIEGIVDTWVEQNFSFSN